MTWVMVVTEQKEGVTTGGGDGRQLCNSVAAMQDARVVTG